MSNLINTIGINSIQPVNQISPKPIIFTGLRKNTSFTCSSANAGKYIFKELGKVILTGQEYLKPKTDEEGAILKLSDDLFLKDSAEVAMYLSLSATIRLNPSVSSKRYIRPALVNAETGKELYIKTGYAAGDLKSATSDNALSLAMNTSLLPAGFATEPLGVAFETFLAENDKIESFCLQLVIA